MKVSDLLESGLYNIVCPGNGSLDIKGIFCCDLLSIAMSKGQPDYAWVTVMGNINTLAVLHLTDMSCIILAEGTSMDAEAKAKAAALGVTVLGSSEPVFETALKIHKMLESGH